MGIDEVALNFSPGSIALLNLILAVIMFAVAIDLKPADFQRLRRAPLPLMIGLASQFLLLPALTFLLVLATAPPPSIALGLILVAACPGGNISNYITHRAGGNAALSVSMTAVGTVGAILLTPLNLAFWGGLYPPTQAILRATMVDPQTVAVTVGLVLILPLVLGITLNDRRPDLSSRLRRPVQGLAFAIFLAFVLLTLVGNWQTFRLYAGSVAALVLLHNALALGGGYGFAALTGQSVPDRRAIAIETGIQNSGLGLALIFAFFGGLGGMAVVAAFWGLWHAVSGLVLAALLRRHAIV
ncbi:bile acid:sodium symporter family protein [Sedimentitalea sp. HM32M-2]|uniref:bile acid:sodium symporter family protein n=1 Tax=Sedimentitalea sp. HM32M-2 TaxID=3351566 RepID=UPI00362BC24A